MNSGLAVHETASRYPHLLAIEPDHTYALSQLPYHHKNPFGRPLIAQAIAENLPMVSADPAVMPYSERIIW